MLKRLDGAVELIGLRRRQRRAQPLSKTRGPLDLALVERPQELLLLEQVDGVEVHEGDVGVDVLQAERGRVATVGAGAAERGALLVDGVLVQLVVALGDRLGRNLRGAGDVTPVSLTTRGAREDPDVPPF